MLCGMCIYVLYELRRVADFCCGANVLLMWCFCNMWPQPHVYMVKDWWAVAIISLEAVGDSFGTFLHIWRVPVGIKGLVRVVNFRFWHRMAGFLG